MLTILHKLSGHTIVDEVSLQLAMAFSRDHYVLKLQVIESIAGVMVYFICMHDSATYFYNIQYWYLSLGKNEVLEIHGVSFHYKVANKLWLIWLKHNHAEVGACWCKGAALISIQFLLWFSYKFQSANFVCNLFSVKTELDDKFTAIWLVEIFTLVDATLITTVHVLSNSISTFKYLALQFIHTFCLYHLSFWSGLEFLFSWSFHWFVI